MTNKNQIVEITEDNINEYLFEELILPIVGYDVKIPQNIQNSLDKILKNDGIQISSFDSKSREFKLGGTYRKVFCVLKTKIEHDIVEYCTKDNPELQTPEGNWITPEIPENSETSKALRIRISLPSSSYATVAIRELLKNSDVTKSFS